MITERIDLWKPEEYSYPLAFGFKPNLRTYLHEDDEIRPAMVVVPGGGYAFVSPTEAGIIAEKFYDYGYNAFVVTYTVNPLEKEPLLDQPARDLSRAIRIVRSKAETFKIDPERLAIVGFSAGGHLCASVCVHFADYEDPCYPNVSNRPDAAILSYPVITSGEKAHRGSFDCLLGKDASEEALHYASLETQVRPDTTPCFLWHTVTDDLVPVENSLYFSEALRANRVPYALHIFSEGQHGYSLADERWAAGDLGEPYTLEPTIATIKAAKAGLVEAPKEFLAFTEGFDNADCQAEPNEEVRVWHEAAAGWLKKIFSKK
ncbi:MAG: alpha/beta hydrolase [Clostridiales bacterium]|nr:alpha/beta hydrolase [Clostridiales bacterium]